MKKLASLLLAVGLTACAPAVAAAQENFPALVVNAVELSGDGAIAGTNFHNGVMLGLKRINAAGACSGAGSRRSRWTSRPGRRSRRRRSRGRRPWTPSR